MTLLIFGIYLAFGFLLSFPVYRIDTRYVGADADWDTLKGDFFAVTIGWPLTIPLFSAVLWEKYRENNPKGQGRYRDFKESIARRLAG